jgi:DNA-binding response OmpR family regulator
MAGESVLIVEDDPTMQRALRDNFAFKGYAVQTASDGEEGLRRALDMRPDLIVLDIMLPKINGYEICRLLRADGMDVPIIMLTAKGEESDIVLGLEVGADDYVTKPFGIRELLARANAFLRRRRQEDATVYHFGGCELDIESRRLLRQGEEVELTPKEFGVLSFMAKRPGRALTRNEILNAAWGRSAFVGTRSVDRCINTLRAKVEADPGRPTLIRTLHGVGYRFEPAEESGS